MTDPIDISVLDDDANRMKVAWKKALNFAASFARDFRQQAQAFSPGKYAPDKYGAEWTFSRWMLLKVGPSEKTALRMIEFFDKTASTEDQEHDRRRLAELKAEKQAEIVRRKAEAAAKKQRKAEVRQARLKPVPKPYSEPKPELLTAKSRRAVSPERQRALLVVREKKAAGLPMNKYRIAEETGIHYSTVGAAMAIVAQEQPGKRHNYVSAKTNGGGDPLAARGHAAWAKIDQGNELWIEGVMELAAVMAEARDQFPANQDFGAWLAASKLERGKTERMALINLGRMRAEMLRDLLKTSRRDSIRLIWEDFRQGRVPSAGKTPEASTLF